MPHNSPHSLVLAFVPCFLALFCTLTALLPTLGLLYKPSYCWAQLFLTTLLALTFACQFQCWYWARGTVARTWARNKGLTHDAVLWTVQPCSVFCTDENSSVGTVKLRLVLHMHEEFYPIHTLPAAQTHCVIITSQLTLSHFPPTAFIPSYCSKPILSSTPTLPLSYFSAFPCYWYHTTQHNYSFMTRSHLSFLLDDKVWTKGWSPSQAGDKMGITMDLWWNMKNCLTAGGNKTVLLPSCHIPDKQGQEKLSASA